MLNIVFVFYAFSFFFPFIWTLFLVSLIKYSWKHRDRNLLKETSDQNMQLNSFCGFWGKKGVPFVVCNIGISVFMSFERNSDEFLG